MPQTAAQNDSNFNITARYMKDKKYTVIGKWILDRRLGKPSMNGILQAMDIPEETIKMHVEKDESMDIMCYFDLTDTHFKIKSFYIQDVDNEPRIEIIPLDEEPPQGSESMYVSSDNPAKVVMKRCMSTVCGFTEYVDVKEIVTLKDVEHMPQDYPDSPDYLLQQTVNVKNHGSGKEHTTIRYYLPVDP